MAKEASADKKSPHKRSDKAEEEIKEAYEAHRVIKDRREKEERAREKTEREENERWAKNFHKVRNAWRENEPKFKLKDHCSHEDLVRKMDDFLKTKDRKSQQVEDEKDEDWPFNEVG